MSQKVVTGTVRLSFPNLFEKFAFESGDKPKFSVMLLIPKTDKKTVEAMKAAEAEAIETGVSSTWGGKRPKTIASVIKDADEDGTAEDYPEREGCLYLNVRTDRKPQVVDAQRNAIMDPEEIYSGVYGRVSMNAFPYKFGSKAGVSFGLNNVQKVADGESLAGGSTAEQDFDILEDDENDLI